MRFFFITVLVYFMYWKGTRLCEASEVWSNFATSPLYQNLRMVTAMDDVFPPRYIRKVESIIWVKMRCGTECALNTTCQAFNFYETEDYYVCELLPDNLCSNKTYNAFIEQLGSSVSDKLSSGMNTSCFEAKFKLPGTISCEALRPGCLGTWPNCFNCTKTCADSYTRYKIADIKELTHWPDGDARNSVPIFGRCIDSRTFLLRRKIDLTGRVVVYDYRMSLFNMHRMISLNAYKTLQLRFDNSSGSSYFTSYSKVVMDSNGKFLNMTLLTPSAVDIFNLNGRPLQRTLPFVTVEDDQYGCGSFWLVDPNNATYCPGGTVGMLGRLIASGSQVVNTGIRYPFVVGPRVVSYASLFLAN